MPSLKEIKSRIASVNSTRKITSAMKMVASSKLHHAQQMIENMLPYENMLEKILKSFIASEMDVNIVYADVRPVKRVALVVYASNSSLCGGFNANVIKMMCSAVEKYKSLGNSIDIYPIGRKVLEKAQKMGYNCIGNFTDLADKPNSSKCIEIASDICHKFIDGQYDKVEMIYHHFKSAGTQVLQRKTYLPIDLEDNIGSDNDRDLTHKTVTPEMQEYLRNNPDKTSNTQNVEARPLNDNFIIEPDMETVLGVLVPKLLNLMVYTALLDSNASEHAARMVAMQTATDNADELLKDLNLQYNKSRQQAITSELLDIVGGSVNN